MKIINIKLVIWLTAETNFKSVVISVSYSELAKSKHEF